MTGQLIGAIIVAACGVRIEGITLPFINLPEIHEITSVLLTIAWIVIVTNAINLMDGLDGLSSGIAVISAISLMVIFVLNGSTLISVVLITALAGALVGFLPFNFTPFAQKFHQIPRYILLPSCVSLFPAVFLFLKIFFYFSA